MICWSVRINFCRRCWPDKRDNFFCRGCRRRGVRVYLRWGTHHLRSAERKIDGVNSQFRCQQRVLHEVWKDVHSVLFPTDRIEQNRRGCLFQATSGWVPRTPLMSIALTAIFRLAPVSCQWLKLVLRFGAVVRTNVRMPTLFRQFKNNIFLLVFSWQISNIKSLKRNVCFSFLHRQKRPFRTTWQLSGFEWETHLHAYQTIADFLFTLCHRGKCRRFSGRIEIDDNIILFDCRMPQLLRLIRKQAARSTRLLFSKSGTAFLRVTK